MYLIQNFVSQNFNMVITALFFAISFLTFIGAAIWLSLLGRNYIKHAERLPHDES